MQGNTHRRGELIHKGTNVATKLFVGSRCCVLPRRVTAMALMLQTMPSDHRQGMDVGTAGRREARALHLFFEWPSSCAGARRLLLLEAAVRQGLEERLELGHEVQQQHLHNVVAQRLGEAGQLQHVVQIPHAAAAATKGRGEGRGVGVGGGAGDT